MSRQAEIDTCDRALSELVTGSLEPRLREIVSAVTARVQAMPELAGTESDRQLCVAIEKSVFLNLRSGLAHLSYPVPLPTSLDPEACHLAQIWASRALPSAALVRTYRLAHEVVWEHWFEAVSRISLSTESWRQLLARVSAFLFAYMDRVSGLIDEEYSRARRRISRDPADLRLELVRDLLRGHSVDTGPLGYDLDRWHLAVVGAGDGVEEIVRGLARRYETLPLVLHVDGVTWAWIGSRHPIARFLEGRIRRVELPKGSRLSFGDPASGSAGFRTSHTQACEAHRIAGATLAPVVAFDDVALESLALRDGAAARSFVARELGQLAETANRTNTLRDTLRAYFAAGQNATAAAAFLKVHEQTISYRLRTIEESLGRPIRARRAELEVALRLRDLLDQPHEAPG